MIGKIGYYQHKKVIGISEVDIVPSGEDIIYAIHETGEMVYMGAVVGQLNWNNMTIEDLQIPFEYDYSKSRGFRTSTANLIEAVEADNTFMDLKSVMAYVHQVAQKEEEFSDVVIPEESVEEDEWFDFDFSALPTLDLNKYSQVEEKEEKESKI
jgi:hypothetical protein